MRGHPLTTSQLNAICERYAAHEKLSVIACELGVCEGSISIIARRAGYPARPGGIPKLTSADREAIAQAYQAGVRLKVIAQDFGIGEPWVSKVAKKAGIPRRWPRKGRKD